MRWGPASVGVLLAHSTGLLSLLSHPLQPCSFGDGMPLAPLRSLLCLVLCQEKAVLKENTILITILAVFPPQYACFLSEPSS